MSRYYHNQPGLLASLQLHPADQINQNISKSHIPDVLSNMFLETTSVYMPSITQADLGDSEGLGCSSEVNKPTQSLLIY